LIGCIQSHTQTRAVDFNQFDLEQTDLVFETFMSNTPTRTLQQCISYDDSNGKKREKFTRKYSCGDQVN